MTNYDDLLKHARGVQEAQRKQGLVAEEESKFIDCTQTMDILEKREKAEVDGALAPTLLTELIATGAMSLGAAATGGSLKEALGMFTLGTLTMGATIGFGAFKQYLISKKYSKERQGLAAEYQAYLDSKEGPEHI